MNYKANVKHTSLAAIGVRAKTSGSSRRQSPALEISVPKLFNVVLRLMRCALMLCSLSRAHAVLCSAVMATSNALSSSDYKKDIWKGYSECGAKFYCHKVFKSILCMRRGGVHWFVDHYIRDGDATVILRTDKNDKGIVTWKWLKTEDNVGFPIRMREFQDGNGPLVKEFKERGDGHRGDYNVFGFNCGDYAGTQFDHAHWGKYPNKHTVIFRPWQINRWLPSSND